MNYVLNFQDVLALITIGMIAGASLLHAIMNFTGTKTPYVKIAGNTPKEDEWVAYISCQDGADLIKIRPSVESIVEVSSNHSFSIVTGDCPEKPSRYAAGIIQGISTITHMWELLCIKPRTKGSKLLIKLTVKDARDKKDGNYVRMWMWQDMTLAFIELGLVALAILPIWSILK